MKQNLYILNMVYLLDRLLLQQYAKIGGNYAKRFMEK